MDVFLDLETIPAVEPTDEEIKACSLCKKPESIEQDFKDNYDKLLQKALKKRGLSPLDSKIVCLGFAFNDEETEAITGSEDYIMQVFDSKIKENSLVFSEITLIGFNIKAFDAQLMWLRACKYNLDNLKQLLYFGRSKIVDVMEMGVYWQYKQYVSLDRLCKYFGIEGKGDVDGSMVYPMFKDGKIEEIAQYCRDDVSKTRELFNILHV